MQKNNIEIYNTLKTQILNVLLTPGTKLSENQLAKDFSVSRTPIREVLQMLISENLVEVVPQKGTYVTKISLKAVQDSLFLRKCVEVKIFEELLLLDNQVVIAELNKIIAKQKTLKVDDYVLFNKLDNLFHYRLYEAVGHCNLYEVVLMQSNDYNRLRLIYDQFYNIENKILEHEQLVAMLAGNDQKSYQSWLEEHLQPLSNKTTLDENDIFSKYLKK